MNRKFSADCIYMNALIWYCVSGTGSRVHVYILYYTLCVVKICIKFVLPTFIFGLITMGEWRINDVHYVVPYIVCLIVLMHYSCSLSYQWHHGVLHHPVATAHALCVICTGELKLISCCEGLGMLYVEVNILQALTTLRIHAYVLCYTYVHSLFA